MGGGTFWAGKCHKRRPVELFRVLAVFFGFPPIIGGNRLLEDWMNVGGDVPLAHDWTRIENYDQWFGVFDGSASNRPMLCNEWSYLTSCWAAASANFIDLMCVCLMWLLQRKLRSSRARCAVTRVPAFITGSSRARAAKDSSGARSRRSSITSVLDRRTAS